MGTGGKLAFFPWLTLPEPVLVGGFRFVPVETVNPGPKIGEDIAKTAKALFSRYVDVHGKPVQKCTVALRPRHSKAWDIPERLWTRLFQASNCLALVAMAEQRFFEQLSPHINATLFRPTVQGVTPGQDRLSLLVRRRDGGLGVGGLRFKDVHFQMPIEAHETECPPPAHRLAKALDKARTNRTATWSAIVESLPFFLHGHSETAEMPDETCVMLSALAFERLLASPGKKLNNANDVSESFAKLWDGYSTLTVANAKRVSIDPHPKHGHSQSAWPIHRKWIKELYEARSKQAHGGSNPDRSSNWQPWQHIVIAAFSYPLSVKLRLAAEGSYLLDARELGACDALDNLLDSNWGSGWKNPPEWSSILSMSQGTREIDEILERALAGSEPTVAEKDD